jgi:hypothetical protein
VVIVLLLLYLLKLPPFKKDSKGLENPGCDVMEQAHCTMLEREGKCQSDGRCCNCDDKEGQNCVPLSCSNTAYKTGMCNDSAPPTLGCGFICSACKGVCTVNPNIITAEALWRTAQGAFTRDHFHLKSKNSARKKFQNQNLL